MAVRDAVKVVSAAKPHVSRNLAIIGDAIDDTSPSGLRRVERARRFLNAIGFNVRAKITGAVEAEVLTALEQQENIEDVEQLEALAAEAADRLTLSDIKKLQGDIKKFKDLRRLRRQKLGDRAVRRIAREGVSAKAPLMGEFTEQSMELPRRAHPRVWVWTANASACAVCLSLHGSRREGAFNPPHPNCLCIAEAPGISRPLTDDEIADQMIKRGGRDARLGQALKEGLISKNQLSIRREGIIKQRNVNIPKVETPEDLLRRVVREGEVAQTLRGGVQGRVYRYELDGNKVVLKEYRGDPDFFQDRERWDETADREVLTSKLADAIGAPVPKTVRYSQRGVVQEWVDIDPIRGNVSRARGLSVDADGAKELGLLDYLIGNSDRHAGNYFWDEAGSKVVGIDHGFAWSDVGLRDNLTMKLRSPFASRWLDNSSIDVDPHTRMTNVARARMSFDGFSPDELINVRRRIRDIKEEFRGRDRVDWYDATIERLDTLIKNG